MLQAVPWIRSSGPCGGTTKNGGVLLSAVSLTSSGPFGLMDAEPGGLFCSPGSAPSMPIGSGGHWAWRADPVSLRMLVLRAHWGLVVFEAIWEWPTSCLVVHKCKQCWLVLHYHYLYLVDAAYCPAHLKTRCYSQVA